MVFVATQDRIYDKIVGNIEKVRARKGRFIAIATEGDAWIGDKADHVIYIPDGCRSGFGSASVGHPAIASLSNRCFAWLRCRQTPKSGQKSDSGIVHNGE